MKYYSIRYTQNYYGGIATAYCSECNLDCLYCYSQNKRNTGKERDAEYVGKKLIEIAKDREIYKCRISGGEATVDFPHLLEVIDYIMDNSNLVFFLETNGIILGQHPEYVAKLASYPIDRLVITVSIKHTIPEYFAKLTKAPEEWIMYPKKAVELLGEADVNLRLAYMEDWYTTKEQDEIQQWFISCVDWDLRIPGEFRTEDEYIDEVTEALMDALDIETFRKYPSVPVTKTKIGELF